MKTISDDQFRLWSPWDIFHAFLLMIASAFVLYIFRGISNDILPFKLPDELTDGIIICLSTSCGTFYLLKEYPVKFSLYGFGKNNIWISIIWGTFSGIILGIIQFPFQVIVWKKDISFELFVGIENGITLVLISLFFAIIFVPVVEELLFRVCVFRILKNKLNVFWGYIGTAAIFSLMHTNGSFIKYFLSSIILTYVYEKTNLIAPCIIAHSIWNMIWFLSMYSYELGLFA